MLVLSSGTIMLLWNGVCRKGWRSAVGADVRIVSCECWSIRVRRAASSARLEASSETCARTSVWRSKCLHRAVRCPLTVLFAWRVSHRKLSSVSSLSWKCYERWVFHSMSVSVACWLLHLLLCGDQSIETFDLIWSGLWKWNCYHNVSTSCFSSWRCHQPVG